MRARLITGATDGVGLELARLWRARGLRPWLHGRRARAELDPALFEAERYLRADLEDPEAPARMERGLRAGGVDGLERLVLNAASGWVGPPEDLAAERARALLEVDLVAPLRLTHLLLPLLRRARGRVVLVSSIAAAAASPRYAVYAAAKAAAEGFFRSLEAELAGAVEVQVVRLGAVRTNLHEKSGLSRGEIPWERFSGPEAIARALDAALSGSPRWRTLGLANRTLFALGRWLPSAADRYRAGGGGGRRTRRERGAGCRVAITGGASGIGRALAERFARAGCALTLIDVDAARGARTRAELAASGRSVELVLADLARADELDGLVATLARGPAFDVLVHNAGTSAVGPFGQIPWDEQRRVLALNLAAPLVLTAGLLRAGRLAPGGSLVFVSSLSRFVSYPGAAVYAATKDGLAHFARSLRARLAPRGAHVLTLYPGPVRTEHARRFSPDNAREARRMPPAHLAELVFRAVERRANVLVPGSANRLLAGLGHLAPRAASRVMRRAIYAKLAGNVRT